VIRWTLWIVAGILLGGIVHLVTVLILPQTATQDAYARIAAFAPPNAVAAVAPPTPPVTVLPFMDPAFAAAVCRYDLSEGPLKLTVPVRTAYTSLSFYTRHGVSYYAINDRAAGRRVIELELMTAEQQSQIPDDEEITAADRLIVVSPTVTGLVLIRALAAEPSQMAQARDALSSARCEHTQVPSQ
jgi:uncharacterized membrane protein